MYMVSLCRIEEAPDVLRQGYKPAITAREHRHLSQPNDILSPSNAITYRN